MKVKTESFELHVSARGVAVSSEVIGSSCGNSNELRGLPLPAACGERERPRRYAKAAAQIAALLVLGTSLGGCAAFERLKFIGDAPPLTAISNPTTQPGYKPVQMPMPAPQPAVYQPNSLWRTGSRAFFKDQRAHQVGDILTVKVKITDKATLENETQRSRKMNEDSGIDNFFGKPKVPIMNTPVPTRIFTGDSTSLSDGKGSIDRKEE
ncbi:MAG: flagellar basal body L-ring protein FlgH, partial [Xanthobacteraceae bacterium]